MTSAVLYKLSLLWTPRKVQTLATNDTLYDTSVAASFAMVLASSWR